MNFQIHEHTNLTSRRSPSPKIVHSHEGGDEPHQHADYGPAFYGHLREKPKYSAKPKGPQLPIVELEEWQKSFEIVVCDPLPAVGQPGYIGDGPPIELLAGRLIHGFKMKISAVRDGRRTR